MRVTRFGHSAVLVEAAEARILIDPGAFSSPEVFQLDGLNAIVVTHQHADHVDQQRIASLVARNPGVVQLADPDTAALLDGFTAHSEGDITLVGDLSITGVGTTHAEILPTIPRIPNTGVLISEPEGPMFFHPGDSYSSIPPAVDVLALPLSAPWAKVSETVGFARSVAPRAVLPIHDAGISSLMYDVYWGHVSNHSGVENLLRLGSNDVETFG